MSDVAGRKAQSHERIVEVASRAIRRAGYQGVGVADIMKEAGLTHGGFYAHFASRDALLVEALERAGRDSGKALGERVARRRAAGEGAFEAVVHAYLDEAHLARTELGCVVAALASETERQAPEVQEAARARVRALVDLVRAALPADAAPEEAGVVAATLVGAMQLARTLGGRAGKALLRSTAASLVAAHPS